MAGWTKLLLYAVLLPTCSPGTLALAQSPLGSLTVKLTDTYARPLAGAEITLRNHATGITVQPSLAQVGVYRFAGLDPGSYTLFVASPQLAQASLDDVEVPPGREVRVQIALRLELVAREEVVSQDAALVLASFAKYGDASIASVALRTAQAALLTVPRVPYETIDVAESASEGVTIFLEQLQALPFAGRNWQSLFSEPDAASVQEGEDSQPAREPRAIRIDGADTTLAFGNTRTSRVRRPGATLTGPGSRMVDRTRHNG